MNTEQRVFAILAGRKLKDVCFSSSFISLLFAQSVLVAAFLRNALVALDRDGIMVAFHPAQYGLAFSVLLLGVFLLLYSALEPARERENGTLETLFYGPLTARAYVLSMSAATLGAGVLSCAALAGGLLAGSLLIGYDVPYALALLFLLTLLFLFSMSSAGIFASLLFSHFRTAVIVVVVFLFFSVALFAGNYYLSHQDISGSFAFVYLLRGISIADCVFQYAFPFGLFIGDLNAFIEIGSIPLLHLAWYALFGCLSLFGSVLMLKRRGVQAR
jgi:hypothetical protein